MRYVKVVPLSRRNLHAFTDRLNATEPQDWPTFLYRAWAIVAIELKKPAEARDTVTDAVAAAHACAVAFSGRTQANEQNRVRKKLLSAVLRIVKPIERRAPIRRELDKVAGQEFRDGQVDLDVIASFFNGCAEVARDFHGLPDAKRILRALGGQIDPMTEDGWGTPQTLNLINHYQAMHLADRGAVEAGLRNLISRSPAGFTALDVFSTIAHALTVAIMTEPQKDGGDLLTAYVAAVRKVWRRAGFPPTRVRNASKSKYRGPYHRFLELVLIDQLDPRSRLFDRLNDEELMRNRNFLASLPLDREEREQAGIEPKYQWLISDHYLKSSK